MIIKKLSYALALCCAFALTGCKPSVEPDNGTPLNPDKPADETLNKLHDDPYTVELILFECHFHGKKAHATPNTPGVKYLKKEQKMVITSVPGKGFQIQKDKGVEKFLVMGGVIDAYKKNIIDPALRKDTDDTFSPDNNKGTYKQYALEIHFYDKKGEEITGQFATNGQEKIHQHFFHAKDIAPLKGFEKPEKYPENFNFMYYNYFDTTPWDKTMNTGAKYTGISNPIGLKGYFEFYVPYVTFDLNIMLMHAYTSKYDTKDGKPTPFYGPTKEQKGKSVFDLNFKVPVVVWGTSSDIVEAEDLTEEQLKNATPDSDYIGEKDKALATRVADILGISFQEAFFDLYMDVNGEPAEHDPNQGRYL